MSRFEIHKRVWWLLYLIAMHSVFVVPEPVFSLAPVYIPSKTGKAGRSSGGNDKSSTSPITAATEPTGASGTDVEPVVAASNLVTASDNLNLAVGSAPYGHSTRPNRPRPRRRHPPPIKTSIPPPPHMPLVIKQSSLDKPSKKPSSHLVPKKPYKPLHYYSSKEHSFETHRRPSLRDLSREKVPPRSEEAKSKEIRPSKYISSKEVRPSKHVSLVGSNSSRDRYRDREKDDNHSFIHDEYYPSGGDSFSIESPSPQPKHPPPSKPSPPRKPHSHSHHNRRPHPDPDHRPHPDYPPHHHHDHPDHDHPPHPDHHHPPNPDHGYPPHPDHDYPPHPDHDHPPHPDHDHPPHPDHDHPSHPDHDHPPHPYHDHPPHHHKDPPPPNYHHDHPPHYNKHPARPHHSHLPHPHHDHHAHPSPSGYRNNKPSGPAPFPKPARPVKLSYYYDSNDKQDLKTLIASHHLKRRGKECDGLENFLYDLNVIGFLLGLVSTLTGMYSDVIPFFNDGVKINYSNNWGDGADYPHDYWNNHDAKIDAIETKRQLRTISIGTSEDNIKEVVSVAGEFISFVSLGIGFISLFPSLVEKFFYILDWWFGKRGLWKQYLYTYKCEVHPYPDPVGWGWNQR